jgi:hypothetical protein
MTQTQQTEHFEKLVDKARQIMLKKGNDYAAGIEDRLVNFKTPGALLNQHPAKVALNLMAVKISRLSNLLDSKQAPNFESIEDTSLDLFVYSILLDSILNEAKFK